VAVSFIGEVNRSTRRKPTTCSVEKWKLNSNALMPFWQEQREMKDITDESPKFNHWPLLTIYSSLGAAASCL